MLAAQPQREWSPDELSRELQLPENVMEDALQTLGAAQLLGRTGGKGNSWCYRCDSRMSGLVERALAAYDERPIEVVRFLLSYAVGRVRLNIDWLAQKLRNRH